MFKVLLLILPLLAVIFCLIMLVKIEVTSRNLTLLLNAVYDYNQDCIERGCYDELRVDYFDIFPQFDTVLYRLFDWGYKNILPKYVFEKIEPFIKK